MITGETEYILAPYHNETYDDFFGKRRRKKRQQRRAIRRSQRLARRTMRQSKPIRISRKAKRQQFFKGVGQVYNDLGRARGIGAAIDTLTQPQSTLPQDTPSDFDMTIGQHQSTAPAENTLPVGLIALGGVAVLGVIGLLVVKGQKQNRYH